MNLDVINRLVEFIQLGGIVIPFLILADLCLWFFLLERYWYCYVNFPKQLKNAVKNYHQLSDGRTDTVKKYYRMSFESLLLLEMNQNMAFIVVLVKISPLLGLLGTMLGMIEVFSLIAQNRSGVEEMGQGIAHATYPTMVGIVVAVMGMALHRPLRHWQIRQKQLFHQQWGDVC